MKVRLRLVGYGEVEIEGNPREVLQRADEVLRKWKVIHHGKEKGEGG